MSRPRDLLFFAFGAALAAVLILIAKDPTLTAQALGWTGFAAVAFILLGVLNGADLG